MVSEVNANTLNLFISIVCHFRSISATGISIYRTTDLLLIRDCWELYGTETWITQELQAVLIEELAVTQLVKSSGFYWTQKCHFRVLNSPPVVAIFSQLNPVFKILFIKHPFLCCPKQFCHYYFWQRRAGLFVKIDNWSIYYAVREIFVTV